MTTERIYLSTTTPYVNARPHLGHALELVQADVLARHHRLAGDQVRFQTGTDDNSLKNVLAAEAEGVAVAELVGRYADAFAGLREPLALSFDDFIRTSSDPRHRPGVERLWRTCADHGDLYLKHYEGRYCVGCEQFYKPAELRDGLCPEHRTPPQLVATAQQPAKALVVFIAQELKESGFEIVYVKDRAVLVRAEKIELMIGVQTV